MMQLNFIPFECLICKSTVLYSSQQISKNSKSCLYQTNLIKLHQRADTLSYHDLWYFLHNVSKWISITAAKLSPNYASRVTYNNSIHTECTDDCATLLHYLSGGLVHEICSTSVSLLQTGSSMRSDTCRQVDIPLSCHNVRQCGIFM